MPNTFEALLAAFTAVLPGAVYTWAFEQQAGRWGANFTDRLWRFVGASAVLLALAAPLVYDAYGRFVVSGRLRSGEQLPWWTWLIPPVYVGVPWLLGVAIGSAARRRKRVVSWLTGPAPSPRAWDHLFTTPDLNGWLLLRMKDDSWVAGFWGREDTPGGATLTSYASGYPEPQELYFSDTARVAVDGAVELDEGGQPVVTGLGLPVRWDEVMYAYYAEG